MGNPFDVIREAGSHVPLLDVIGALGGGQTARQRARQVWSKSLTDGLASGVPLQQVIMDTMKANPSLISDMEPEDLINTTRAVTMGLPTPDEEYTLSPGQKRMRGNQVIAESAPELSGKEKDLALAEQTLGRALTPVEKQRFFNIEPPQPTQPKSLSIADVIAPIFQKLAQGGQLTPSEQNALDTYRRLSPFDRMVEQTMTGQLSGSPTAEPTTGNAGNVYGAGSSPNNPVTVKSSAEWQALAPGTYYITSDGKRGRR